jgi:hypothetical protein
VEGANGLERGDGTEVELTLRPGVKAKAFALGDGRVVVDLRPAAEDRAADASPSTGPENVARAGRPAFGSSAAAPAETTGDPVARVEAPPVAARAGEAGRLEAHGRLVDGDPVLAFEWDRPVGAAVFLRAGHLWTVFGAGAADRDELLNGLRELESHVGPAQKVEADGGLAIRFALRLPLFPEVARDGASWRVRLQSEPPPVRSVEIVRLDQPVRLRVAGGEPPRLVRVTDPTVGDTLEIWPLVQAGLGQPETRRLVELELLASTQASSGGRWRTG